MTFILQSVPLSLTLYGPDLSHCPLTESLLIQRTRKGPYALCPHATPLQQRHETRIDVPWLEPAAHRPTASVSCQIHYGCLRGLKWRRGNVSAGKLHPAKVNLRSMPGKVLNYTEDGLNIQWLLSVWLHDEVPVRQFQKKLRPSLCHHCIYAQRPSLNNLREGWSKISTPECLNTTFQSSGTAQKQKFDNTAGRRTTKKGHFYDHKKHKVSLGLSPLSYSHLIWENGTVY